MHIRPDQFAFVSCRRLQRYAGATVLYFLSTDPLAGTVRRLWPRGSRFVRCNMRARAAFKCGHDPDRKIALNPHKQAISLQ